MRLLSIIVTLPSFEMETESFKLEKHIKEKNPLWLQVAYIASLAVATAVLLVVFVINGLAAAPNAQDYGFENNTVQVSNKFYLQVTPAGWTFAIWGIIYAWQTLWILYAWSFIFRPQSPKTVSWIALLLYTCNNVSNIVWVYLWGYNLPQVAFPFIILMWGFLVAALSVEAVHIYKLTPIMQTRLRYKVDLWISRLLVTNGIAIYVTWLTTATLINLGIVLQYFGDVDSGTTGTIVLWLLSIVVLAYFALENAILDRFTRFIFIVYLVFIWALSGVLSAHWGQEDPNTNPVLTLLLLILVIVLLIARVVLIIIFSIFRPLPYSTESVYKVL